MRRLASIGVQGSMGCPQTSAFPASKQFRVQGLAWVLFIDSRHFAFIREISAIPAFAEAATRRQAWLKNFLILLSENRINV